MAKQLLQEFNQMGRDMDSNVSALENGAGKRRRCESFPYQFEVLNAADEIRGIRPATFNIYAIFKKNKILK